MESERPEPCSGGRHRASIRPGRLAARSGGLHKDGPFAAMGLHCRPLRLSPQTLTPVAKRRAPR
jgi:hypothetical protein